MLYCRPKCEYFTDDQGKQVFRCVHIKIWDDKEYFDPAAVRRNEEYDDIDEAIARLEEFGDEPSFDMKSRLSSAILANLLIQYKQSGVLNPPDGRPKVDGKAIVDRLVKSSYR